MTMPMMFTGDVPLHIAAREDNIESARRLLRAGAAMENPNNQGVTPQDLLRHLERDLRLDIAAGAVAREVCLSV